MFECEFSFSNCAPSFFKSNIGIHILKVLGCKLLGEWEWEDMDVDNVIGMGIGTRSH